MQQQAGERMRELYESTFNVPYTRAAEVPGAWCLGTTRVEVADVQTAWCLVPGNQAADVTTAWCVSPGVKAAGVETAWCTGTTQRA